MDLVEVAEKLRIREINFQNYIGRFLYQFWPSYGNSLGSKRKYINVRLVDFKICTTQLVEAWVFGCWFRKRTNDYFWIQILKAFYVEFWRISVDILTVKARYIHFSSLMVVKSFSPEATKMFDSLWCSGPKGPSQDILLKTIFLAILHLTSWYILPFFCIWHQDCQWGIYFPSAPWWKFHMMSIISDY